MFMHDVMLGPISIEQVLLTALSGALVSYFWVGTNFTNSLYYGGILAAVEIAIEYIDSKFNFLPPFIFGIGQIGVDLVSALIFGFIHAFLLPAFSVNIALKSSAVAFVALVIASYAHDLLNKQPLVNAADEAVHESKKMKKKKHHKKRSEGNNLVLGGGESQAAIKMETAEMVASGQVAPLF